ncbi:hypothetical protein [Aulosira sp. FACHB-615]|uniref:hypothetical protein n=1 Tax=Aulosira sp. FACHB-615 TaxID=2692777 RepID=UPI001685C7CE|nr:hypothetical protein [Aulosira sp. FACHB-615]MBD2492315.1 hypothetical protein [Aulosira sp. FACHB-615]MBD2492688.1 hypothetical protein [Aulosira sp. FACHB-615]
MQPTINIPQNWDYPRFTFGDRTQQGIILGMEYYLPNTPLAHEYGHGWRYAVMPDDGCDEIRYYFDDQLQTLSIAEVQQKLQAEIDEHQQQIKALQQQLVAITGGSTDG